MIRTLAIFSLLCLIALFQVTIIPAVVPASFRPNVVLAASMCWGARAGYRGAVPIAVAAGLIVDLWSDAPFGLTALLAGMATMLTIIGETPLIPSNVLFPLALSFIGELLLQGLRVLAFQAIGRPIEVVDPAFAIALATATTTALLVLLIYPLTRQLQRKITDPTW